MPLGDPDQPRSVSLGLVPEGASVPDADSGLMRCIRLCAAAFSGPASELDHALGLAVGELLQSPHASFAAVPPAPTFASGVFLCVPAVHDDKALGYLTVSGRTGGYGDAEADLLDAVARLVGWLLHSRSEQTVRDDEIERNAVRLQRQVQIIEHLQESVIAMDLSGFITDWNKGAERMLG